MIWARIDASFGPPPPVAMETDDRFKETPGLMFIHLLIVFRPHANVQMEALLVFFFSLQHPEPHICLPLLLHTLLFDIEDRLAPL